MERLLQRNRAEEISSVSLEYLESLHRLHEAWLVAESTKKHHFYKPPFIIIIDGDQPIETLNSRVEIEINKLNVQ